MPVDPMDYRNTLAQWASGVTVVTVAHAGRRYGMTASSFSSVSLEPPLVLICVGAEAYTHSILLDAGIFAINILRADQIALGQRFAEKTVTYIDRFTDLDVTSAKAGSPALPGVLAWLECRTVQAVAAGDHTVFIAEVIDSRVYGGEPLLYAQRQWGTFLPIE